MNRIRIAVAGAGGKMGRRILTLAAQDPELQIVGALEHKESDVLGMDIGALIGQDSQGVRVTPEIETALKPAQVLIDFTSPQAADEHLRGALKLRKGLVLGTTGLSEKTKRAIRLAARRIPILQSPNMSTGVNLLFELAARAAKVLQEGFDIEISEVHHRTKKDAPSGTALELARLMAEANGWDPKKKAPPIHALRGGDVVGEHTVSFLGEGETLELVHRATSRDAFARGALQAAKFLARQRRGIYNMRNIL